MLRSSNAVNIFINPFPTSPKMCIVFEKHSQQPHNSLSCFDGVLRYAAETIVAHSRVNDMNGRGVNFIYIVFVVFCRIFCPLKSLYLSFSCFARKRLEHLDVERSRCGPFLAWLVDYSKETFLSNA